MTIILLFVSWGWGGSLRASRQTGEKDGDSMTPFVMESLANVDGRGFQEQRYAARSWRRLLEIDNQAPWGILLVTRAMRVRMLHCELKWEIPNKIRKVKVKNE